MLGIIEKDGTYDVKMLEHIETAKEIWKMEDLKRPGLCKIGLHKLKIIPRPKTEPSMWMQCRGGAPLQCVRCKRRYIPLSGLGHTELVPTVTREELEILYAKRKREHPE